MSRPQAVIVGRPNVGKSTLFNKIAGKRISIVADTPGVTRDRVIASSDWNGREFTLIDTGGLVLSTDDRLLKDMRYQTQLAIDVASVIIFVVDGNVSPAMEENEIALMLKKSGKPVVLAVNKIDSGKLPPEFYEYYSFNFDHVIPVSALHGTGTGDLLDEVVGYFGANDEASDETDITVAIVGRPNAGKSSLLNMLSGEKRSIVSDIPGTTRDAVDTVISSEDKKYTIIDTAGIRKKSKIKEEIENYSYLRAVSAIDRAKVVLLVIDASDGVSVQDTKIAGLAHDEGKSIIIVINKWDLIEKNSKTMEQFTQNVRNSFVFMNYAPILYMSALTGLRMNKLLPTIDKVYENASKRLATGVLNECISKALLMNQPPSDKGKQLKIYYAAQVGVLPPTIVLFVNDMQLFHFSYKRYIENQLRENFGFEGSRIELIIRNKGDKSRF